MENKKMIDNKKSVFCIIMYDEHRWYENTSGKNSNELMEAYYKCNLPFVEMQEYGKRIECITYALIEQSGEKFDFSLEFNYDKKEILHFDGENITHIPMRWE